MFPLAALLIACAMVPVSGYLLEVRSRVVKQGQKLPVQDRNLYESIEEIVKGIAKDQTRLTYYFQKFDKYDELIIYKEHSPLEYRISPVMGPRPSDSELEGSQHRVVNGRKEVPSEIQTQFKEEMEEKMKKL